VRSLALRPGDSLTILTMALSMGFRSLISRLPAIQATGLLALALAGLFPAERASLCWTHQNPFVERFIGSARRECLDHVIVFNEAGLQRLMTLYCSYYERSRTHLSLDKDTPIPRLVTPPGDGAIVAIPEVGGLHHRYERRAA
jgi:Integrase core domain